MKISDIYISTEYILERISEEEIFEHFLQEEVVPYSKSYINPIREDENAGCKFFYNEKGELIFHDLSYKIGYNCFSFVKALYNVSWQEALKIIKSELIKGETVLNKADKVQFVKERVAAKEPFKIKRKNYTPKELKFWDIADLNITQEILEEHEIYSVETYWENKYVVDGCNMTFAYYDNGIPLQLYFPKNKGTKKRRFSLSEMKYWGGLKWVDFSKPYLFIIPKRKCSFYATQFGINNMYILLERWVDDELIYWLKSKGFLLLYLADNDRHGKSAAWMYRKLYNVEVITMPEGKDFTECLQLIGKNGMLDLIKEYEMYY